MFNWEGPERVWMWVGSVCWWQRRYDEEEQRTCGGKNEKVWSGQTITTSLVNNGYVKVSCKCHKLVSEMRILALSLMFWKVIVWV